MTKDEDCRAQSGVEGRAFPEHNLCLKLGENKRQQLQELLSQRAACFPEDLPMELLPSHRCDHAIKVEESSRPPLRPPFRMSAPEMDELQRQLQDLISHRFIEPSNSPYGAPVFLSRNLMSRCDFFVIGGHTSSTPSSTSCVCVCVHACSRVCCVCVCVCVCVSENDER